MITTCDLWLIVKEVSFRRRVSDFLLLRAEELEQLAEKKINIFSLLGIYSKEHKTLNRKNIITPMFIAALFTIAKIWKQPKCPSADEWIKQLWDIYTMEYYLAIKKKSALPFVTVWMDMENITLSEIS